MIPTASKGFTLLEILISMAIFTIIGIASTALLSTVIDSDELSADRFEKLTTLQRAMTLMERDFLQALPRPVRVQGELNEVVFRGGRDQFESETDGVGFVRGGWHNPQLMLPRSTLQGVAYRLNEQKLERMYGNYLDNVIGFEPKIKVILEGVTDFQVEFLSAADEEFDEDNWQETYQGTQLPKAVAVTITTEEFGTITRRFVLGTQQ
ncbi:type II secretion system minor pseudopilin GspJ [Aestuariibacter salexigens]|uniref:type II secretion system minor pseudopilin GspJ n=1 Tax=Aestuariibacter salexigens TaxID=226010 RepID=UPI00041E9F8D|nr:type II secretion system minor pseudopilin GspJ [Aestuariibacter salexigens]